MASESHTVRNLAGLEGEVIRALATSLAEVRTLGDLLEWGRSRKPKAIVDEIITQDEYTHGVLVPLEPPLWLAFDVT